MAAAQSVDQNNAVIFQTIKQSFDIDKLNRYVGALLQVAYLPADKRPDALHIDGRLVGFGDIEDELKRFAEQFNETLPDELRIPLDPFDIFSTKILSRLIVAFEGVDAYDPEVAKSNMPRDLHEKVEEMRRYKEAQLELGKKREDALSSMDRQIKASLERYRYAQQLKLTAQAQLERMFLDTTYLKNLQDLELALGGRGALEAYVKQEIAALVEKNISVISVRQLDKLIADNPGLAASYFKRLILQDIQQHDLFRTAYFTAHPQKKKEALKAIEEEAKGAFEKAQPHAQVIEQERESLRNEGIDPDELNALSASHRPMAEIRRWTQTALKISTNERFIEKLLIREAEKFGIRLNVHDTHLWVGRLRQLTDPDARRSFLRGRLEGLSPSQLNALFQIVSPQLNALAAFTPETIREAAQWRPDLLPNSVVKALTSPTSSLSLPEHQRAIREVAEKTGVSVDHVEAYAAGLNRQTLDTHLAQARIASQQPWYRNFQEKSLPKLEQWFGPKGAIPQAPAPAGAPQAPAISHEVAANFRQLAGVNAFRTRIGQSFRFLRLDRAANFVARSAPVRAVTNVVTSPLRAVGNTVNRGVTGVKNWAKSQIVSGATSVATKLIGWGTKAAVQQGVTGLLGKGALWAGTNLLAVAGGTAIKSIPVIGQAIGAVQAVGGATLGFLGSTLDFIRGKKSFGEWGASAFKSAGTLIGAAVGGLLGAGIGLLGLGVGAIPGALIGIVIGAMVGGMLTGGLAAFAKKPEEALKSLFGLLLMGGLAFAMFAQWALTHVGALIGGTIGAVIGTYLGATALGVIGFGLCGPLCAVAGTWIGGIIGGTIGAFVGMAIGTAVQWFFGEAVPQAGVALGQLLTLGIASGRMLLNAAAVNGLGLLNAAATSAGQLLTIGQIGLRGLIGWIGQAGWTLGGSIMGGIGGFFMGGAPGALLGGGLGAVGGSWLASGGLNSLLSGIGPALTNSIVGATNFLGSLTAPLTASSIVTTTTTVVLGGVAAAGGITMLFVIPTILSALYVPPDEGSFGGGFIIPPGCPAPIWPLDLSRGQRYAVTQGAGGWCTHGPPISPQPASCPNSGFEYSEAIDIGTEPPNTMSAERVVIATHPGIVQKVVRDDTIGNYVRIQDTCGGNFTSVYVHMEVIPPNIIEGMVIIGGEILGPVGDSGAPAQVHVHYEFRESDGVTHKQQGVTAPPFMTTPYIPATVPWKCVGRAGAGGCNISIP